jgi:hypothetical protein
MVQGCGQQLLLLLARVHGNLQKKGEQKVQPQGDGLLSLLGEANDATIRAHLECEANLRRAGAAKNRKVAALRR